MDLKSLEVVIGNNPIVEIKYKFNDNVGVVYAELGWFSLTGSIKDRVAYQILNDAYLTGDIKKGDKIVEVSSGNMGISLVAMANLFGNPVTIIMPQFVSEERKKLLMMYGATLVEVDSFKTAFKKCEEYKSKGYFCPSQFENDSNEKVHYEITANNILNKLNNKDISTFVCGIGTSGTLMGVGKKFKEEINNVQIVAIEPTNARIISGVQPLKPHKLQGFSDEILPKLYNKEVVDKVIQINDNDAIAMAQKICKELSLGVGISSGANFLGCVLLGVNAVTVFPDDNKKYISTDLSKEIKSSIVDGIELLEVKFI